MFINKIIVSFKVKCINCTGGAVGRKMASGWRNIMLEEAGVSGPNMNLGLKLVPAEYKNRSSITSQ